MFSHLAEKAAFYNHIPRLTQATNDDGEPTPGYLLDEITNITYQSVTASHLLVDYLIHRLGKSSSIAVKIKVLKIIVYVINMGHVSYRQQLRLHDGSLKDVLHLSGPADPLLGNTLYKDAQKLAQEALDLLFNPETLAEEDSSPVDDEPPHVFMAGMGASSHSGGKYEGFGNTANQREGTVTDKMLDYFGRFIHPSDDQTSEAIRAALHSSPGDYQPVAVAGSLTDPVLSTDITPTKTSFVKNHVPGRAGGGWESDEDDHKDDTVLKESEFWSVTSIAQNDPQNCFHSRDTVSEESLQNEATEIITNFSQILDLPSIEELDSVCSKCATVGYSQVFAVLCKVNSDLLRKPVEEKLLRVLFLYEWLYHYDHLVPRTLDENSMAIFETIVNDKSLTGLCKSKAKKLKLLYKSTESVPNEPSDCEAANKENIC